VVSIATVKRTFYVLGVRRGRARLISLCAAVMTLCGAARDLHAQADSSQPEKKKETIVVTGVYEPVPLAEVDRPITLIDVRANELLSKSLADFLRLDPSVDVAERGANGTEADISMRGGTFEQTLVLLDGLRMNDLQTGHHDVDLPVPLDAVSRIEVLHGSGSTLYGSDAVGGVINFITEPPRVSELRLRAGFGNFGVNQQSATWSLVAGRFAEQLSFARDFSTGFMPDRDYRSLDFSSLTDFSTALGATQIILASTDRPFGANQFYGDYDSWERLRTWFAAVNQHLGKSTEASFAFRRRTDLFVLLRDNPEYFENRHALESYQAALRRRQELKENVRLFYGAEGYSDGIHSTNLGDHTRGRVAAYAALDVRALGRFSFNLGAREEVYRSVRGQFSPSLSASYWLDPHWKLRGSASHAFRVPSLTDLYYHDPANLGSPNLRPERAWNTEAGVDWNGLGGWQGGLTLFERRERDVIDYARPSAADPWQATNIDRLRFHGVETSLRAPAFRRQQIELSYTALRGYHEPTPGIDSRYAFEYAVNSGTLSWQTSLPRGIYARSRVGLLERYGNRTYGVWDVYLARSLGRVHPFVQLTNLTNTAYEEIQGVAMPGRAVVAGAEVGVFSRRK